MEKEPTERVFFNFRRSRGSIHLTHAPYAFGRRFFVLTESICRCCHPLIFQVRGSMGSYMGSQNKFYLGRQPVKYAYG